MKKNLFAATCAAACWAVFPASGATSDSNTDVLSHQYDLGPFKLSFGPQSDGHFGATLKGEENLLFATFSGPTSFKRDSSEQGMAFFSYGNVAISLDSGWTSAAGANNNATAALKPTVTLGVTRVHSTQAPQVSQEVKDLCKNLSDEANGGQDAVARLKAFKAFLAAKCPTDKDPYHDLAAISLYPSLEYRIGHFTQDGTQYQANQVIYGAGSRLFFPSQLNDWWASWPFVSATYYHVKNNSGSNIPLPDGVKADYISGEAKVDFLLPVRLGQQARALEVSVDLTSSKATTGADRSWQFLKNVQVLVNLGGSWKPAVTYKEGKDRGLSYDKQVILGVAAELF